MIGIILGLIVLYRKNKNEEKYKRLNDGIKSNNNEVKVTLNVGILHSFVIILILVSLISLFTSLLQRSKEDNNIEIWEWVRSAGMGLYIGGQYLYLWLDLSFIGLFDQRKHRLIATNLIYFFYSMFVLTAFAGSFKGAVKYIVYYAIL